LEDVVGGFSSLGGVPSSTDVEMIGELTPLGPGFSCTEDCPPLLDCAVVSSSSPIVTRDALEDPLSLCVEDVLSSCTLR